MMKLYDYILSPSCYKVRLMAALTGVTLELRAVDFHPGLEHRGPELLALNPAHGGHCALLVDRLAGLRNPGQLSRLPDPAGPRPAFAGARYRDTQGQVWQEIDLAALARQEQFLGIAA